MTRNERGPTLTDPTGMGGVVAVDGFDYQLWDALARLPSWLANPAFEAVIFEGLEDVEARFFAPQAAAEKFVDRFQAKSGQLAPKDVRGIFEHFHEFEAHHPNVARVQTLVTPRLPPTIDWVARDTMRVRRARPFFAPFPAVVAASDAKLTSDLVEEFGDVLGHFVANSVEVAERVIPNRETAIANFGVELARSFPLIDSGPKKIEAAFGAVESIARSNIGKPLWRRDLIGAVEADLGTQLVSAGTSAIHIRSDRNENANSAIDIDARAFSGGAIPFPDIAIWNGALVHSLVRTGAWLSSQRVSRVSLSGSYRLSTAFVVGWALRSAMGFELEIPTKSGPWQTNDHPMSDDPRPRVETHEPVALIDGRLVVAVGIIRRPGDDLIASGLDSNVLLAINFPEPITSGQHAQRIVAVVKQHVSACITRLRPRAIELYLAGPAAFAVALGHRWNAMAPTQLHERNPDGSYVPTARL